LSRPWCGLILPTMSWRCGDRAADLDAMHLDLTDAGTLALLNLLVETIEADR